MRRSRNCVIVPGIIAMFLIILLSVWSRNYSTVGIVQINGAEIEVTATIKMKWFDAVIMNKANGSLILIDKSGTRLVDYVFSGIIFHDFQDTINYAPVSVYDSIQNSYVPLELYYDDNMDFLNIKTSRFEFKSGNNEH